MQSKYDMHLSLKVRRQHKGGGGGAQSPAEIERPMPHARERTYQALRR